MLADLQAQHEPVTAESVARRVEGRTVDVLHSIQRLTMRRAPPPDPHDEPQPAEQYPAVVEAQAKVSHLQQALPLPHQLWQQAETAYQ